MIDYMHPKNQWDNFCESEKLIQGVGAFAYNSIFTPQPKEKQEKTEPKVEVAKINFKEMECEND